MELTEEDLFVIVKSLGAYINHLEPSALLVNEIASWSKNIYEVKGNFNRVLFISRDPNKSKDQTIKSACEKHISTKDYVTLRNALYAYIAHLNLSAAYSSQVSFWLEKVSKVNNKISDILLCGNHLEELKNLAL